MKLLNLHDPNFVKNEITSVLDHKKISFHQLYDAIKESFLKNKNYDSSDLTPAEKALVKKLLANKYTTPKWNLQKNGKTRGACYIRQNRQSY